MKYIKIHDNKGNNRFIRLYSTKRSKNVIAIKTAKNETLYAGSGSSVSGPSVLKVQTASGIQNICEYADSIPNTKLIAQYTTTQNVTLSKNLFPYGGMVITNGGKGTNSYGAGGKGSSARMYFGALLHNTILHVTIGVNNGSAGTSGTNTTVRAYGDCINGTYADFCPDKKTISSSNATAGGAGGKGSRATLDYTGETINAYGGGGGGGNRGSIHYAYDCDGGCDKRYTTAYGSFGSGGASGNNVGGSGVSGGSAGSSENVSVAIYAFTE